MGRSHISVIRFQYVRIFQEGNLSNHKMFHFVRFGNVYCKIEMKEDKVVVQVSIKP